MSSRVGNKKKDGYVARATQPSSKYEPCSYLHKLIGGVLNKINKIKKIRKKNIRVISSSYYDREELKKNRADKRVAWRKNKNKKERSVVS